MDRRNLLDAIFELGGDLTILTADDDVPDKDCVIITTKNIIPKDNRAKMPEPSVVDNVNSLKQLQEALNEQHDQDLKLLRNQGIVVYGVSLTLARYSINDIPEIIQAFNANMARLREAKQQQE